MFEYICKNGELEAELDLFKYIVRRMAQALKVLHQKGVIHRNINPRNIFLNFDFENENKIKEIKLGDFSCSTLIKDNKSEQTGTFFYSSPEIISGLEYNEKTDLWSLGITLFEIFFWISPLWPKNYNK